MPRTARIVIPDYPYHITQRGNYRQVVFRDDGDRIQYLSWINEYSTKYYLSILGYCLMDNHIHFIALPQKENSLAKVFSAAHMRYSQYFNKQGRAFGHLWQGRFYSCVLDQDYLMVAMRYVERNPVRAKMVNKPWQWKWSSASAHVGQADGVINLVDMKKFIDVTGEGWKQFIDLDDKQGDVEAIRKHTMTGRPLGTEGFIKVLSRILGQRQTQEGEG